GFRGKFMRRRGGNKLDDTEVDGKTGANIIEVHWEPPKKEEPEPPKEPAPPVRGPAGRGRQSTVPAWMKGAASASDPAPAIPAIADQGASKSKSPSPVRGPAGRGRGAAIPAWKKQGVGNTATAEIDRQPHIPEQTEEDEKRFSALDELFEERAKPAEEPSQRRVTLSDHGHGGHGSHGSHAGWHHHQNHQNYQKRKREGGIRLEEAPKAFAEVSEAKAPWRNWEEDDWQEKKWDEKGWKSNDWKQDWKKSDWQEDWWSEHGERSERSERSWKKRSDWTGTSSKGDWDSGRMLS
ncbi:unnamed protein product, partial [Effrenium voratum]